MTGKGLTSQDTHGSRGRLQEPVIGAQMRLLLDEIAAIGSDLTPLLNRDLANKIKLALDAISKKPIRVAVLGQMKAGKSSFVNALIGRPGLLPTDVNPWTTVVTRLHFAIPGQPTKGARFTFFDAAQWHQLVNKVGAARILSERLIPGLKDDEDLKNREILLRRVDLHLGRFYKHLFGKTVWYGDPTKEIIERYVCVGQHVTEQTSELVSGRFADITRTADIYFDRGPFAVPMTVIDTPGTNDPLLIRDEVTMQSIEDSDVYVVVLTAQHPLTTADLALMRMLHGLRKDRLLVFINRIDDIAGIVATADSIFSSVTAAIKREFPASHIPIVMGSAIWANTAIEAGKADLAQIWRPDLFDYARYVGALTTEEALGRRRSELSEEERAKTLYACSGMPQVRNHIANLMLRGATGRLFFELGTTFLAVARGVTSAARGQFALSDPTGKNLSGWLDSREQHQLRLEATTTVVEQFRSATEIFVREEVAERLVRLRTALQDEVSNFAAEQARAAHHAWLRGLRSRVWRCDSGQLRNRMEDLVLSAASDVSKLVALAQSESVSRLNHRLQELAPGIAPPFCAVEPHNISLSPSLTPLSKAVVFDLDDKWWNVWWKSWKSAEERGSKLRELVLDEFGPVAIELSQSTDREIEGHALTALQSFFGRGLDSIRAQIDQTHMSQAASAAVAVSEQDALVARARLSLASGEALAARIRAWLDKLPPPNTFHDSRAPQ